MFSIAFWIRIAFDESEKGAVVYLRDKSDKNSKMAAMENCSSKYLFFRTMRGSNPDRGEKVLGIKLGVWSCGFVVGENNIESPLVLKTKIVEKCKIALHIFYKYDIYSLIHENLPNIKQKFLDVK